MGDSNGSYAPPARLSSSAAVKQQLTEFGCDEGAAAPPTGKGLQLESNTNLLNKSFVLLFKTLIFNCLLVAAIIMCCLLWRSREEVRNFCTTVTVNAVACTSQCSHTAGTSQTLGQRALKTYSKSLATF